MRKCRGAHAGRASYVVVATNCKTEHYIPWPERKSLDEAIQDVHTACDQIPPREFKRLKRDDDVTFFVDRQYPYADANECVWSWRWDPAGPPPSPQRTAR